tara:strand:- start:176 stop:1162 length:987 start_codon:yes stop_codon:yes gene_type:complete
MISDSELKPKISIILPVFNGAAFIADAINSVLIQTFNDFELIIINDASYDKSKEIILSFKDSRIVYIENITNLGQISSVNQGIKIAKANLVGRIDQDDVFLKEKLELQYEFFKKNKDIAVVGTWAAIINEDNNIKKYMSSPTSNNRMLNTLLNSNPLFHPSVVIRKDILLKMGLYSAEYEYTEDYYLWCRLVLSGYKIANIPKYLLHYREHHNQSSQENRTIQLENALKIRNLLFKKVFIDLQKNQKIILKEFNSLELSDVSYTCSDIHGQRGDFKNSKTSLHLSIKYNWLNMKSYLMLFLLILNPFLYKKTVIKKNILRSKLLDSDI